MSLSTEQLHAISRIQEGKNIFITGSAGTGKSFLLKTITKMLDEKNVNYRTTATTGIAANNIGGVTFHQMCGLGLAQEDKRSLLTRVITRRKDLVKMWNSIELVIIDEVSMMDIEFFEKMEYISSNVRGKNHLGFGGVQLILIGDFYQLPPIATDGNCSIKYIFEHELWEKLEIETIILTRIYRQDQNSQFCKVLERLRVGEMLDEDYEYLESLTRKLNGGGSQNVGCITSLYPTNKMVDIVNDNYMNRIDSEEKIFRCDVSFYQKPLSEIQSGDIKMPQEMIESIQKSMIKNSICGDVLKLKIGCEVMLCVNKLLNPTDPGETCIRLYNGCRGIIVDFDLYGTPVVKFYDIKTDVKFFVGQHTWEYSIPKYSTVVTFSQIPLKIAYALTVHKSQGLTIKPLIVSIGREIFTSGQIYVALSRATSEETLQIISFCKHKKITADPRVKSFYEKQKHM